MLSLIIPIILGTITGMITGLTPGIHINLVNVIIISLLPFLTKISSPLQIICFIISMSIIHTFLDFIPSTFLGVPDTETSLSLLPMHRMLLDGKGYEAVLLSIIGSLFGLILIIILTLPIILTLKKIYPLIENYIPHILLISITFLLIREKKSKIISLFIFLLSGILGIAVLNLNVPQPLFPLFSGLFGTSMLIISIKNKVKISRQLKTFPSLKIITTTKTLLSGIIASFMTGTLPGLGATQAAIISSSFSKIKEKYFILLTGAIGTIIMYLSVLTLFSINRSRSGSVVAISKIIQSITKNDLIVIISITLITAGIAVILALKISEIFSLLISKVNYNKLCIAIIIFITTLVTIISGFQGLIILITATFIGIITQIKEIPKNYLMGSLILPILLFFTL